MKVLVVGSGGREHALCWALAASPLVTEVLCAPGNAGIAAEARCVPVAADDVTGLVALAQAEGVGLVVVGPEVPLVLGLVDRLRGRRHQGVRADRGRGPARGLESLHQGILRPARHPDSGLPHLRPGRGWGRARLCRRPRVRRSWSRPTGSPPARGSWSRPRSTEALAAVDDAFAGGFGAAGQTIVIEECLAGEEASLFALCDGADCAGDRHRAGPQARL